MIPAGPGPQIQGLLPALKFQELVNLVPPCTQPPLWAPIASTDSTVSLMVVGATVSELDQVIHLVPSAPKFGKEHDLSLAPVSSGQHLGLPPFPPAGLYHTDQLL